MRTLRCSAPSLCTFSAIATSIFGWRTRTSELLELFAIVAALCVSVAEYHADPTRDVVDVALCPSTSTSWAPRADLKKSGVPPTPRNARTGESIRRECSDQRGESSSSDLAYPGNHVVASQKGLTTTSATIPPRISSGGASLNQRKKRSVFFVDRSRERADEPTAIDVVTDQQTRPVPTSSVHPACARERVPRRCE